MKWLLFGGKDVQQKLSPIYLIPTTKTRFQIQYVLPCFLPKSNTQLTKDLQPTAIFLAKKHTFAP